VLVCFNLVPSVSITGGELFDRIIELHHYSEKDASKVIRETLLGIQHMHQKGIAHRDLKVRHKLLLAFFFFFFFFD